MIAGTLTAPARAAEPTKAEIAVARQYFDAATAAENQGRWRDAIDQLNKAIAIKETAGLRYHLGFAKENLGMLVDAMLDYQRASGLIHSGMTSEEVERFIVPKLEEMRRRVPTLTVTLPPDAKGVELQVDGAAVKPELLGTPIPLNPGTHALVVFAPSRRPFRMQVTVSEGSAVTQAAELVPEVGGSASAPMAPLTAPPSTAPVEHREAPVGSGSSAKTWVLIGEGAVAAAGLGIGVGYLAAARTAALSDRRRDNSVALAGFVGAGVGASAFVATLILWKTPSRQRSGLFATPHWVAGGAGLTIGFAH